MALQEEFELQGNFLFRYRGVLPMAILALAISAYIFHIKALPVKQANTVNELYSYCCLLITILGFAIRIYTVGHADENTSGRNTKSQIANELNTTGIYSIVRHPLYLGNFLMWLGIALLTQSIWFVLAFVFIFWVYYERIMFTEEQFLRKKFGDTYMKWAEKTPAFIPQFKLYKPYRKRFNLRKVLRQEKTGLFLIFLMYFLFDEIGSDIIYDKIFVRPDFWMYALIVAAVAYGTIKFLQKKTKLVD
jgi:protein-S-isoprenylcysteine O-methyltransferase Ste14